MRISIVAFAALCLLAAFSADARQGDVDHDCQVTAADLSGTLDQVLHRAPTSAAGDADSSGAVTVADATLVARFLLGLKIAGATPGIAAVTPLTAEPGQTITLTGCDFDPSSALANRVRIGGVLACVTAASETSLTVLVPSAATTGAVDVGTAAGSACSDETFVPLPLPACTVDSASPATGESWGGTHLVIVGHGFAPGVSVDLGGMPTTRPRFVHPWELHVDTPAHAEGPVDIVVTNPGSSPVTLSGAFTYAASPAPTAQPGFIYTMVGNGNPGYEGEGFQARATTLYWPDQAELDWDGRLVIADWNNHRIRRVDEDGTLETLIGYKHGDSVGPRLLTALNHPTDVLFDDFGNMYVGAWHNFKVKALDFAAGQVVTWAGGDQGYAGDGLPVESARFNLPVSLAWLPAGEMVVVDAANQRIREIDLQGRIRTIAGTGVAGSSGDGGPATSATLHLPNGEEQDPGGRVSVDRDGSITFTDTVNDRVRRIDRDGVITTIAGTGAAGYSGDGGPATAAQLNQPTGLAVAADGTIFLSEEANHVVRRIDPAGIITTICGSGQPGYSGDRGPAAQAVLDKPNGLVLDRWGNLYVCDKLNSRIRVITSDRVGPITIPPDPVLPPPVGGTPPVSGVSGTIDTYIGTGTDGFNGDGLPALATDIYWPHQVAIEPWSQLVYFIDWNNHRVRKVEANGTVVTVAGTGDLGDDYGSALTARFNHPSDLAFEPVTNDLIIDAWHNDKIKKLRFSTNEIEHYVGVGRGFAGDGGPALNARLSVPAGVEFDAQGRLYIGDQGNQRVRRVNLDGTIETVAGRQRPPNSPQCLDCLHSPAYSGDGGPATQADLYLANVTVPDVGGRVCIDAAGNLYVADTYNSVVRRVDTSGIITTYAGNATEQHSGDGGPATAAGIFHPVDVVIGPDKALYIAEREAHCIRRVDADTGIITTFAGTGTAGFAGDGGAATAAQLYRPSGINFNAAGDLFIADTGNSRIRVTWH